MLTSSLKLSVLCERLWIRIVISGEECEECEKRFHASCSNLGDNEESNLVMELGVVQTVKLTVVFAVVLF